MLGNTGPLNVVPTSTPIWFWPSVQTSSSPTGPYVSLYWWLGPVHFIREAHFSQMPGKERNLSLASPASSALPLWNILSLLSVGHLTCTAEQFSLSQEEKASLLLSIHLSVQGDLLFHSSWRLSGNQWDLVLFLLASATFSFYHICCWLLLVCCSLQPSAKTNILTAARGSLDWHIIKGSKGHISRLK